MNDLNLGKLWKNKLEGKAWQIKSEFLNLLKLMLDEETKIVLEVGTYKGGTALGFMEIGCEVVSIDIEKKPEIEILEKSYGSKFTFLLGQSQDYKWTAPVFDMLFIDGDHSYIGCKKDYENLSPYVRKGGIIVFHDIKNTPHHREQGCEVYKFWEEVRGDFYEEFCDDDIWGGIGVTYV